MRGGGKNVEEHISFDALIESAPEKLRKSYGTDEPRTLEITYVPEGLGGPSQQEVVYEDPGEGAKRPRLLVSLQSVLALKALCEREFARQQNLVAMLHQCRCAYFKELLWLREQLLLAARPEQQFVQDAVKNYEVYWFEPSQYVNEELREFLVECIRHTNRKLIEDNYLLRMQLGGKSAAENEDTDVTLKRLLKRLGPSKVVKMVQAAASSKDQGSKELAEEFQGSVLEIAAQLGWAKYEYKPPPETFPDQSGQVKELEEALRDKASETESLRNRLRETAGELDLTKRSVAEAEAAAAAERARAAAEQERADAERQRAEQAEADLAKLERERQQPVVVRAPPPPPDTKHLDKLKAAADRAADRVNACVVRLGRMKSFRGAGPTPPTSPSAGSVHTGLEQASAALEDLLHRAAPDAPEVVADPEAAKALQKLQATAAELQAKVAKLEQELQEAREAELRAKQEAAEALRKAEEAAVAAAAKPQTTVVVKTEVVAATPTGVDPAELKKAEEAHKAATKRAAKAEKEAEALRKQVDELKEELAALKKEAAGLRSKLQDAGGGNAELLERLGRLEEQVKELKLKLREAEEQGDEFAGKLSRAQDRIRELKEEVKHWKRKAGEEVDEEDDDEEDLDLPNFLISYAKRNRNRAGVPRWSLLSEDARLGQMKREYLFGQKSHVLVSAAASSAFHFLQARQNTSDQPPPKKHHSREHSPEQIQQFLELWNAREAENAERRTPSGGRSQSPGGQALRPASPLPPAAPGLEAPPGSGRQPSPGRSAGGTAAAPMWYQPQHPQLQPEHLQLVPPAPPQRWPGGLAGYEVVPPQALASAAAAAASAAAAAAAALRQPSQRQGRSQPAGQQFAARGPAAGADAPTVAMSLHVAAMCGWTPPLQVQGRGATPGADDARRAPSPPSAAPAAAAAAPPAEARATAHSPSSGRALSPGGGGRLEPMKPPLPWAVAPLAGPAAKDAPAAVVCAALSSPSRRAPGSPPPQPARLPAQPPADGRSLSAALQEQLIATAAAAETGAPAVREGAASPPSPWGLASASLRPTRVAAVATVGVTPLAQCQTSPLATKGRSSPASSSQSTGLPLSPSRTSPDSLNCSLAQSRDFKRSRQSADTSMAFSSVDFLESPLASPPGAALAGRLALKSSYTAPSKIVAPQVGLRLGASRRSASGASLREPPDGLGGSAGAAASSPLGGTLRAGDLGGTLGAGSLGGTLRGGLGSTLGAGDLGGTLGGGGLGGGPGEGGHGAQASSPQAKRPSGSGRGGGGDPNVTWGRSRSTAALPLTNAPTGAAALGITGGRAQEPPSPSKPQRGGGVAGGKAGPGPLEGGEEGFIAEVLPPLPQGRVRKAPPPSWMLAMAAA